MHNLHLIIINADSPEEACMAVEGAIEDWGNENNGRVVCGCIGQDNTVHSTGEGRYCPEDVLGEVSNAINYINGGKTRDYIKDIESVATAWTKSGSSGQVMGGENKTLSDVGVEIKKKLDKHFAGEKIPPHEWYQIEEYVKDQYQLAHLPEDGSFDIWNNTFYECEYANCGVTNLADGDDLKKYIVFLDMHS